MRSLPHKKNSSICLSFMDSMLLLLALDEGFNSSTCGTSGCATDGVGDTDSTCVFVLLVLSKFLVIVFRSRLFPKTVAPSLQLVLCPL